jgi:peptidyl-prolyl cis-trans isomerase A (cyclophilin A)
MEDSSMNALVVSMVLALVQSTAPPASTKPAPAAPQPAAAAPVVVLDTSLGAIKIELNREKAPVTVDNFLKYVRAKHYDGTIFHRVIPDFMIQGGGMDETMVEKATRPAIKNEGSNGLRNARGTIAMARLNAPNSATAQFFINVKDNAMLDYGINGAGYAVFGRVTEGMDVVDRIRAVKTGNKGSFQNVPVQPVVIRSIRLAQ